MESPETLLEHATWLRRLAAGLVGDRTLADDIVQDTWVAALGSPPGQGRPLRPWLARVVRNAARFRWRSDANRAAREAATAGNRDAVTPTSEELLARHELQQLLAKLVGELDEPFRATILLRYAEGLEPTQIARRLSIPAGTVRWRIKEGLERLRLGLDTEHGGNRKAWLLALAPIALWPRVSHSAPLVPIGIAIASIAAIVIVVGAMRRNQHTVVQSTTESRRTATAATRRLGDTPTSSWFVQPGTSARRVTGRVVRDGLPVVGALVRLIADDAEPLETHSVADGRFDFGLQSARMITLGAARPDSLAPIRHVDLRDPTTSADVELPLLACGSEISGKITDAIGNPIAHARVLREDTVGTETDNAGAYDLCSLPTAALASQLDVVVRADGYGTIATRLAPAGRMRRNFVLAPEATITGTSDANAAIWLEPDRDDRSVTGERAARQVAIADADGRFRISGASGGRYRVGGAARGKLGIAQLVSVEPGATVDVVVRMVPSATVRGHVVVRGAPLAGARVAVRSGRVVVRHDDPSHDEIAAGNAVTQADGSFVLEGVPVGLTTFAVEPVRIMTPPRILVAGDNTITLEGIPLGRIRGVVRRHGAPVPYARIDMNGTAARGITTDGSGRYDLDGLEPGKYDLWADDQRRGAFIATQTPISLGDGETRVYDLELAWGAQIIGTVVDASGVPVKDASVRFTSPIGEQSRCMTDGGGTFVCGSLKGDASYLPTVYPRDEATRPFPFVTPSPALELGGDSTMSGIRLSIDTRTTTISGTVLDESGAPAVDVRVHVSGSGLNHRWSPAPTVTTDGSGRFRFDHLAPGDYDVDAETMHDSGSAHSVIAGGATDVVLSLSRATCTTTAPVVPSHKPARPIMWDDRIELVGWDMPALAQVGKPIEVTLVFRARAPIAHQWEVFAHFDSSEHRENADHSPVSDACPTSTWKPGDVFVDRFSTTLRFAEPFTLKVGFFRFADGDGPTENLAGAGDLDGVELGSVAVSQP